MGPHEVYSVPMWLELLRGGGSSGSLHRRITLFLVQRNERKLPNMHACHETYKINDSVVSLFSNNQQYSQNTCKLFLVATYWTSFAFSATVINHVSCFMFIYFIIFNSLVSSNSYSFLLILTTAMRGPGSNIIPSLFGRYSTFASEECTIWEKLDNFPTGVWWTLNECSLCPWDITQLLYKHYKGIWILEYI